MRVGGRSARALLLLGAGASRGAIPHVLLNQKRIKAPLNLDFFKVAETYARATGAGSASAKRLERLRKLFKTDLLTKWPPPMETAFSLLYTAKDFPEIYAAHAGRRPDPGSRQELDDFLVLLFDILFLLDKGASAQTNYDRLVGLLEEGDAVVTFNYDTMLDSALHRRGWDPKAGYGLGGGSKKFKWKALQGTASSQWRRIPLYKLHGSANWWVRGSIHTFSSVFDKKPVIVGPPRRNQYSRSIRQIIPPIYGKVFRHAHWRRLWRDAFKRLCFAEVLVVVGCSIADTDYHLQAFLRRVAQERKRQQSPFKLVCLVDRARIRRRWMRVLRGAVGKQANYATFQNFLQEGRP